MSFLTEETLIHRNICTYFLITCSAVATGSPPIARQVLISGKPSASVNLQMYSMLSLICLASSRDGTIIRPEIISTMTNSYWHIHHCHHPFYVRFLIFLMKVDLMTNLPQSLPCTAL